MCVCVNILSIFANTGQVNVVEGFLEFLFAYRIYPTKHVDSIVPQTVEIFLLYMVHLFQFFKYFRDFISFLTYINNMVPKSRP